MGSKVMQVCRRCNQKHWPFQSCEEGKRKYGALQIQWRGDPMGLRPHGDHLTTLTRSGDTLYRRREN